MRIVHYLSVITVVGCVFLLVLAAASAASMYEFCSFPTWCPWTSWDLCWAAADCDFGIGSGGSDNGGTDSDPCVQCKKDCAEEYASNRDTCDGSPPCLDLALTEYNTCMAYCAIDYANCS